MSKYIIGMCCLIGLWGLELGLANGVHAETADPVFYASFDEQTQATQAHGKSQARVRGDVSYVPGVRGQAIVCGEKGYVSYAVADNFDPRNGTVTLWMRPLDWTHGDGKFHTLFAAVALEKGVRERLLIYKHHATPDLYALADGPGEKGRRVITIAQDWNQQTWHHYALSWTPEQMALFVDGRLVGQTPRVTPALKDWKEFSVGRGAFNNEAGHSAFDELKLFDRALSAEEVATEYAANSDRAANSNRAAGLDAIWEMPEPVELAAGQEKQFTLPGLPTTTGQVASLYVQATPRAGMEQLKLTVNAKSLGETLDDNASGLPRLLSSSKDAGRLLDISDVVVSPTVGAVGPHTLVVRNGGTQPVTLQRLAAGYVSMEVAMRVPSRIAPSGPEVRGAGYSVVLAGGGGLLVKVGTQSYLVDSNFSYPHMPAGAWNELPAAAVKSKKGEWKVTATQKGEGFEISGQGGWYRLQRTVGLKQDRIIIRDRITNLSDEDIAIAFDNKVTAMQVPREINVSGKYKKSYFPYSPQAPATNPTIFLAGENAGLGMVALDDFYRLQFSLKQQGRTGSFENRSFGLPAKDSYTFEWALYPTASSDYYDFINLVREDYVPATTIQGGCAFLSYDLPMKWPREKMAEWLRDRSAKIVIFIGPYGGAPWLGGYSQYKMPVAYDEKQQLADLKKAREILREIDPTIKCIAPFETAMTPENAAGDTTPRFPDSTAFEPDGVPVGYKFPADRDKRKEFEATKAHAYVYYPTMTNSYYQYMLGTIEKALHEAEMDGIYFDIFTYTGGFRWTYDSWDNRSVDMDLTNYTIRRKKADLAKLSEDARAALVSNVLAQKPNNVVVANYMPVTEKVRALPIFHFKETLMDYGYMTSHFSTPIMLGWTTGYTPGARSIGKEGDWWQDWKTDEDYFGDIKDKLRHGNLYYTYWAPPGQMRESNLTHPTILEHMFPITVQKIGAGTIQGKERIITLHSGRYSWNVAATAKAYFYDRSGKEIPGQLRTLHETAGKTAFEIEVPPEGAVVIEKQK